MESLVDILLFNVVAFLVVLTIIVAVHEAGHFIVARLCRVRVETFSIGFGPELFGWTGKAGTRYKICALPLGGYVRMAGGLMPGPADEMDRGDYPSKTVWQRLLIILAGPFANFLFAFVLLVGFALAFGSTTSPAKIGGFTDDSPAAQTELAAGDLLVGIDGKKVETFGDLVRAMALHTGGPVDLEAERDGVPLFVTVEPREVSIDTASGPARTFRLGITSTSEFTTVRHGPFGAAKAAFDSQIQITVMVFQGLGQVVTGKRPLSELEGPVGMSKHVAEASKSGFVRVLEMMIFLSMIIGLMNLLPIPVLDGGHVVFLAYEALFRRPLPARVMEVALMIGLGLVLTQFVFVTFQDLVPNGFSLPGWLPRF